MSNKKVDDSSLKYLKHSYSLLKKSKINSFIEKVLLVKYDNLKKAPMKTIEKLMLLKEEAKEDKYKNVMDIYDKIWEAMNEVE